MEYRNVEKLRELIKDNKLTRKIDAIFLYGSSITKEKNEYSDIDVLIVAQYELQARDEEKLLKVISSIYDSQKLDISIYDNNKFQNLLDSGALFIHHLKNEGLLIYSSRDKTKEYYFNNLKEFKGLAEDVLLYRRMLIKTKASIELNGINYFDLCILSMITRNTLTLLNYKQCKEKCKFGKSEVFKSIKNSKLKLEFKEYCKLLEYRSYFRRGFPKIDLPSIEELQLIFKKIEELVCYAIKEIGVKDTIDRLYFLIDDNNARNLYTSFEVFTDLERDMYFYLKKYGKSKYKLEINSIKTDYIEFLIENYNKDEFFSLTLQILNHIERIKKKSNNYSINFPDLMEIRNMSKSEFSLNKLLLKVLMNIKKMTKTNIKLLDKCQKKLESKIDSKFIEDLERYRNIIGDTFK